MSQTSDSGSTPFTIVVNIPNKFLPSVEKFAEESHFAGVQEILQDACGKLARHLTECAQKSEKLDGVMSKMKEVVEKHGSIAGAVEDSHKRGLTFEQFTKELGLDDIDDVMEGLKGNSKKWKAERRS